MERNYKQPIIAIAEADRYPENAPFHPSVAYPEYRMNVGKEENGVYAAVRDLFQKLGLDEEHYGDEDWNPLGSIIHKGQTVVIKPNFVKESNTGTGSVWSTITHPAVIRAVIDYVYIALDGEGRIIIAEAPTSYADFEKILAVTQLESIRDFYQTARNFNIEIVDLREYKYVYSPENHGHIREYLRGDPEGYTVFNLSDRSRLKEMPGAEKYYGSEKNRNETVAHHTGGRHEYFICNTILNADVVITLPKMKTHGQVAATLNVKNFIGCIGNKNYLPHFRVGYGHEGGDEFLPLSAKVRFKRKIKQALKNFPIIGNSRLIVRACRMIRRLFAKIRNVPKQWLPSSHRENSADIHAGAPVSKREESGYWFGNDTLWRTVSDVFSIIEYGNKDGTLSETSCRKVYGIIDGVLAGDHNGPNANDDRECGILIAGNNMIASDLAAIRLMGFDFRKIPLYKGLTDTIKDYDSWIQSAVVKSDVYSDVFSASEKRFFDFREPDGWKDKLKI